MPIGSHKGGALGSHAAVEVDAAVDVSSLSDVVVQVSGTFVGTVQIEVSQDGTNFAQFGANQTAPGILEITIPCKQIRSRCSAYTSGTAVTTYGGRVAVV